MTYIWMITAGCGLEQTVASAFLMVSKSVLITLTRSKGPLTGYFWTKTEPYGSDTWTLWKISVFIITVQISFSHRPIHFILIPSMKKQTEQFGFLHGILSILLLITN